MLVLGLILRLLDKVPRDRYREPRARADYGVFFFFFSIRDLNVTSPSCKNKHEIVWERRRGGVTDQMMVNYALEAKSGGEAASRWRKARFPKARRRFLSSSDEPSRG